MSRSNASDTTVLVSVGLGLATVLGGVYFLTVKDDGATAVHVQASLLPTARGAVQTVSLTGRVEPIAGIEETYMRSNERDALRTLRAITSAQASCQGLVRVDRDGDGTGEYAYLGELMGLAPVHGPAAGAPDPETGTESEDTGASEPARLDPPLLGSEYGELRASARGGVLVRGGYAFQVFLPDGGDERGVHTGLAEAGLDGVGGADASGLVPDPVAASHVWCCYAWPLEHGVTGERAFFVNQNGDVLECDNAGGRYSGLDRLPRFDAALASTSPGNLLAAPSGFGASANDGQAWRLAFWE